MRKSRYSLYFGNYEWNGQSKGMPRGCSGWHSRETNASADKDAGKVVPLPQEKTEIIQVGNVRYKQLSANTVKMTGIKRMSRK